MKKLILSALLLISVQSAFAGNPEDDGYCYSSVSTHNQMFCDTIWREQCVKDFECRWHVRTCRGQTPDTDYICRGTPKESCIQSYSRCVWR